jgi:hypothetical protein
MYILVVLLLLHFMFVLGYGTVLEIKCVIIPHKIVQQLTQKPNIVWVQSDYLAAVLEHGLLIVCSHFITIFPPQP